MSRSVADEPSGRGSVFEEALGRMCRHALDQEIVGFGTEQHIAAIGEASDRTCRDLVRVGASGSDQAPSIVEPDALQT
jgi:hypothetical protein